MQCDKITQPKKMNLDWICTDANCGNINFAHRTLCYRCSKEKPDGGKGNLFKKKLSKEIGLTVAKKYGGLFSPDDWQCNNCANVNWARRQTCNVCSASKFGVVGPGTGCETGVEELSKQKLSSDDDFDDCRMRNCKREADVQWETPDMVGVTEKLPPFVLQTGASGYDTGPKRSKQDDSHTPVANNPVMENMISSTNNEIVYKFTGATPAEDFVLKYTLEEKVKAAALAIVYNNCKISSEKFEVKFNKPAPDFKTIFGWRQRLLTTGCLIDSHLDISQDIINLISKPQTINSPPKSEPNTHTEISNENYRKLANPVEIPISSDSIGERSQNFGTFNWKTSRQNNHRKANPHEITISSDNEDDRSQNVGTLNWNSSRPSNDRKLANPDEIPISSDTEDDSSQNVGTHKWNTFRQSNRRKFANQVEIPISSDSEDESSQNLGTFNCNTSRQSNDRKFANPDEIPISSDIEHDISQNVGTLNWNTSRQSSASIENVIDGVEAEIYRSKNNVSESRARSNTIIRATQQRTQTKYCKNQDFNYFHSVSEDVQVKMDLERNKKSSLCTKKLSQDLDSDLDSDVDDFISLLYKDKEGCIEKSDRQTCTSHFGQQNMYGPIWEPIH